MQPSRNEAFFKQPSLFGGCIQLTAEVSKKKLGQSLYLSIKLFELHECKKIATGFPFSPLCLVKCSDLFIPQARFCQSLKLTDNQSEELETRNVHLVTLFRKLSNLSVTNNNLC